MSFDFESIYTLYPNKEGKKSGMAKLEKTIKTEEEYRQFLHAVRNYLKLCEKTGRIQKGYVMMWKTFVNNWQDYLDNSLLEGTKSNNLSQLERIAKGEL